MIEYLASHPTESAAAFAGAIAFIGFIVKLTPTKKDDKLWRKLMQAIGKEPKE